MIKGDLKLFIDNVSKPIIIVCPWKCVLASTVTSVVHAELLEKILTSVSPVDEILNTQDNKHDDDY